MTQKLSAGQVGLVKVFLEFGFSKTALAEEYGVHVDTIRNIDKGVSFTGTQARRKDRKLNDAQVRLIRQRASEGVKDLAITRELGGIVSKSTVRQVIDGKSYKDVV